jgi:hypothetical protein
MHAEMKTEKENFIYIYFLIIYLLIFNVFIGLIYIIAFFS